MKVCIITTTKRPNTNLGDALIADRCADLATSLAEGVQISKVFHREEREAGRQATMGADLILIACLAIRRGMFEKNYPFIHDILQSGIPLGVISAGISLSAFSSPRKLSEHFSHDEVDMLRRISEGSVFFSSRGYLTQEALAQIGVASTFAGDVAFFEPRFRDRKFQPVKAVRRIAVSDPHYATGYRNSFLHLIAILRDLFPEAGIDILVHGINDEFMPIAQSSGATVVKLYEDFGLDHYDSYDLHVGYRVHGHVSALARRVPSYLIEQDDRGADYGATFSRRISISSHRNNQKRSAGEAQVLTFPIDLLGAMLRQDMRDGFRKFAGLEDEVVACGTRNREGLMNSLASG